MIFKYLGSEESVSHTQKKKAHSRSKHIQMNIHLNVFLAFFPQYPFFFCF